MSIELVISIMVCIIVCASAICIWTRVEKQDKFQQEENHKEYLKTLSEYNSTKLKYPTKQVKPTKPTNSITSNRSDRVDRNSKVDDDFYISSNSSSDSSYSHHSAYSSCGGSSSSDCGSSSCD